MTTKLVKHENTKINTHELTALYSIPHETFKDFGMRYVRSGKIREVFEDGNKLILVTTDRISAFDRILGTIPGKGQILNEQSAWWFEKMKDIIPNHVLAVPDPNVTIAKKLKSVPIEVIVRGVITGVTDTSLWVNYQRAKPDAKGFREVYGMKFPPGLKKNDVLPKPIITPTTKAEQGKHDEKISEEDIVARGIVAKETWQTVRTAALTMFAKAQNIARKRGYILVDTKMEFGTDQSGKVYVMDELFTGDSSRFWLKRTMKKRLGKGEEPENYDKEYLRIAYKAHGYGGEGKIPAEVPQAIQKELLRRYVAVYEALAGKPFAYPREDARLRMRANVAAYIASDTRKNRIPQVIVIMGSKADLEHATLIRKTLTDYGVACTLRVGSAHKNPQDVLAMVRAYDADQTFQTIYIAVAGRSNALGGFLAGETTSPVISCPPEGQWYDIFSSLRMPSDIAVSLIVEPKSAALFAISIFAISHPELQKKLTEHRESVREKLTQADAEISKRKGV